MVDTAQQAAPLDPRLREVLQQLAANLTELNALLATAPSNPAQPAMEAIRAVADTEITAIGDNEPTIEDIFKRMAPTRARVARLTIPWDPFEARVGESDREETLDLEDWRMEGFTMYIDRGRSPRIASGLGELDNQGVFHWDNRRNRAWGNVRRGDDPYFSGGTHCVLGRAYMKPDPNGYLCSQPVGAVSGSSITLRSGVYASGCPMSELWNFTTEHATHGKIWIMTPLLAAYADLEGTDRIVHDNAIQQTYACRLERLDLVPVVLVSSLCMDYSRPADRSSQWAKSGNYRGKLPEFLAIFLGFLLIPATSKGVAYISNAREERWLSAPQNVGRLAPMVLMLELHLRHFMGADREEQRPGLHVAGLALTREEVLLAKMGLRGARVLTESVSSLCLILSLTHSAPYTILALLDTSVPFFVGGGRNGTYEVPSAFPTKDTWVSSSIVPCGRATGVAQFLSVVLSAFKIWETGWTNALDEIDETVSASILCEHSLITDLL
ncbi:hypothetical protein B0T25DRAFT_192338 [Lasiosphaeria hispida]|uniref:Uncharacterized protein n=1 Tax=Lasiosphaeria hispida TaxID=260671 RepID=A0AAJ0HHG0_9PEZI|nr:hypothetical protein B0T25DRAFT_192338 [Lasiosphaeria hispida]